MASTINLTIAIILSIATGLMIKEVIIPLTKNINKTDFSVPSEAQRDQMIVKKLSEINKIEVVSHQINQTKVKQGDRVSFYTTDEGFLTGDFQIGRAHV